MKTIHMKCMSRPTERRTLKKVKKSIEMTSHQLKQKTNRFDLISILYCFQ